MYFNPPEVDADGDCAAMAVEVRDTDHSYSITAGDEQREFKLSDKACKKVKQYGAGSGASAEIAAVRCRWRTAQPRADAAEVGIVPAVGDVAVGRPAAASWRVVAAWRRRLLERRRLGELGSGSQAG